MSSPSDDRPLLLDTHVWYWLVVGDPTLAASVRDRMHRAVMRGALRLAAISIWEIALLASRGRITLARPTLEWVEAALVSSRTELEPLTPRVSVDSCGLPRGLHGDPADRIIVATARCMGAVLLTRDRRMLDYAALGHVAALAA